LKYFLKGSVAALVFSERLLNAFALSKKINLVWANQGNYFENTNACSKCTLKTTVATQLKQLKAPRTTKLGPQFGPICHIPNWAKGSISSTFYARICIFRMKVLRAAFSSYALTSYQNIGAKIANKMLMKLTRGPRRPQYFYRLIPIPQPYPDRNRRRLTTFSFTVDK